METKLIAKATIKINAPASKVWEALTKPELIKKYFFGTEAISDWKVGSPILFKGIWEGKEYMDKGIILRSEREKLFEYTYLSSFSGLEDVPENYATITYKLVPENSGTKLTVTQDNIATEETKQHSEQNWSSVLNALKELLEAK
jgi:uncharacterized protein YndB with AHSA1/START domain